MAPRSVREIHIPISFEAAARLGADDSGLSTTVRVALKDRKRTTEAIDGFESTLTTDEGRQFLVYAKRHGFTRLAIELRRALKEVIA